jgi:Family of unknown function (DUF6152)
MSVFVKATLFSLSVVCGAATATTALAHHSSAMFDRSETLVLSGTIKEYQFLNPHTWIEILVEDENGETVQWSIEASGRRPMVAMGLGPTRIKPGDKVTVRAHPLRDGRTGGLFIDITLPDGEVISGN